MIRSIGTVCAGFALALSTGCGGDGNTGNNTNADTCMAAGGEKAVVITQMKFARQDKPGISVGFDIDHYTASQGDAKTCGHASLTSPAPDSTPGVDNQFSSVIPAIDAQAPGVIDTDLQDAINSGMLLFGLDLTHLDDRNSDGCVQLAFNRLSGMPTVGTDKILDANQTFEVDTSVPTSSVQGKIAGGVLEAGPLDLTLPVKILDANFVLTVHDTYFRMNLGDDGNLTGVLGGALDVDEVVTKFSMYAIGADLKKMLPDLLANIADQAYDSTTMKCKRFSVALTFSAKNAFINR